MKFFTSGVPRFDASDVGLHRRLRKFGAWMNLVVPTSCLFTVGAFVPVCDFLLVMPILAKTASIGALVLQRRGELSLVEGCCAGISQVVVQVGARVLNQKS